MLSIFSFLTIFSLINPFTSVSDTTEAVEITEAHYRIYHADGRPATMEELMAALNETEVVFVGEGHNDKVAHHLEAKLFEAIHEYHPNLTLSLEMFERDVQTVMDEYLVGYARERDMLKAARPWRNYEEDYRPMVEFAKENGLAVLAANAPHRYVIRVGKEGPESLTVLSDQAKKWLPPVPFGAPSESYTAKYNHTMAVMMEEYRMSQAEEKAAAGDSTDLIALHEEMSAPGYAPKPMHDNPNSVWAQALRDASMAYSIVEALVRRPADIVYHVNGSFHSEDFLGTPEQLARYRPGTRTVMVTILASDSFPEFNHEDHYQKGDFVIVTDNSVPKSY